MHVQNAESNQEKSYFSSNYWINFLLHWCSLICKYEHTISSMFALYSYFSYDIFWLEGYCFVLCFTCTWKEENANKCQVCNGDM